MTWKLALELPQLIAKKRETTTLDGHKLLFIWHDDQVHAVAAQCPHFKLPLQKAEITKECALVCPFHKSEFDLNTGEVKCWSPWPQAIGRILGKIKKPQPLKIYPTKIEEGKIYVNLMTVPK